MMADIEKKITRQAKWSLAHPKERWAHSALRSALKRGLIEKRPCQVCGSEDSEAHHPDYDRPMLVEWYCRTHHKAEHRRLLEGGQQ
ncbi:MULTISPECIES: hypothetical protein [unclassified Rhizobium]|uniref:hypothetical protein n=1 Tax=unclassified Rhizobium TaxID=2613769 RepID=UPI0017E6DB5F|nr:MULTISPECIES: hypothetical protein [unclassified Rhizobium]MBB3288760.1 hypothetical protein [Rhizobium sp. BK252]MBB3403502.1 hypothetical protein [Rhizobium sp. BK289]MBB3416313.1 hypothetical protein [Rhizobium sp. BK284]MBB3483965.1 hypothetical protein [Rhizobium sp. BK347]